MTQFKSGFDALLPRTLFDQPSELEFTTYAFLLKKPCRYKTYEDNLQYKVLDEACERPIYLGSYGIE